MTQSRRAVSEMISALLLTGIVVGAGGGVLAAFGNDMGLTQGSILSAARAQVTNMGKLISYVYSSVDASENLIVQVSNYGYSSITPATVYVDGTQASNFVLLNMNGITVMLIATGTVTSLKITGASPFTSASGHTVVIVDTSGLSFEVKT